MLVLEAVKIQNFLSYAEAELTFDRDEPTLVIGLHKSSSGASSNGSGKTALFESILYGLFGKTTSGRHNDNAVKDFGEDCVVYIQGKSNNKPFTIHRYRKHTIHKNKTIFNFDGKPLEGGSSNATQSLIEKTLGIDFDLILQTCYFSPSSIQTFCGMTDSEQKSIFQSILDLDKWEKAQERIKAQQNLLTEKYQTSQGSLEVLTTLKKRDLKNLQDLLKEIQDLDTSELVDKQKRIKEYIAKNSIPKEQVKKLETLRKDILLQIADLTDKSNIEKNSILAKQKLAKGTCPTCSGPTNVELLTTQILEHKAQIKEYNNTIKALLENKEKIDAKLTALEKKQEKINDLTAQSKSLGISIDAKKNLKFTMNKRLKGLTSNLLETTNSIKQHTEVLDFIRNKQELYKKLETIFGITGARTYIIKQVLPYLNKSLKHYSSILCPDIAVELSSQRKITTKQIRNKFDVKVVSPTGGGYPSLSSGEAKRVDLCIVFSFLELIRNLGKETNFLILDEILDNLDPVGEDSAIALLNTLGHKNLFLISHKSSLASRFSNVLVVEKDNNTSTIKIDS